MEEQKLVKVKLGVLAIDSGYMNASQVDRIHKLQVARDRRFGELAVEEGYLTENQLNELLNAQKKSNVLIGQVLIENGFFTLEKYEEILLHYRQYSDLTDDEIQALKTNDVKKITEIFLRTLSHDRNKMLHEYFELFIRNIIRFIDDGIRVEEARKTNSYSFDYLVTQRIEGEQGFFSGFSASETVLTRFASIYAEEELDEMNALAKDALGEFMNCQNGLFLSHLSHEGIELGLLPAEVKNDGNLKSLEKLYIIPCYLNFGRVDFLFADKFLYFQ
ncbi:MAG: hypothetical protein SA378_06625 [Sedimentibacter sp.]|uniref:hypothetical protein n=1 Tax=Sedimentibacter sp. TaxID=1960295 RepID=UPI0029818F5B|nr:hypothetical protein [Sedimentibacter sp.]MDW5299791.1 hypothetical protein [Sedimentibacter sp.]